MCGLPGSGKSFLAKQLRQEHNGVIISTDHYYEAGEHYLFSLDNRRQAHEWNQWRCKELMLRNVPCIIVDNTNLSERERKPYVDLGKQNGYNIRYRLPETEWKWDLEECFKRNVHGVPMETLIRMKKRYSRPRFWDDVILNYDNPSWAPSIVRGSG